jgi:hypothetical protein
LVFLTPTYPSHPPFCLHCFLPCFLLFASVHPPIAAPRPRAFIFTPLYRLTFLLSMARPCFLPQIRSRSSTLRPLVRRLSLLPSLILAIRFASPNPFRRPTRWRQTRTSWVTANEDELGDGKRDFDIVMDIVRHRPRDGGIAAPTLFRYRLLFQIHHAAAATAAAAVFDILDALSIDPSPPKMLLVGPLCSSHDQSRREQSPQHYSDRRN